MSDIDPLVIPKPQFEQGLSTHYHFWPDLGITVEISRIQDDRHCEIMVTHKNGNGEELILQPTSTNLISHRELSLLAKRLSNKTPQVSDVTWDTMLGYVSYESIKALRKGDPVIMLDESYGKKTPDYLLSPLLVSNVPNIIYADRGSLKTKIALLFCLILNHHWVANPFDLYLGKKQSTVLFLDWENSEELIGWDKDCLIRGLNLPYIKLAYRHCSRPFADDLPAIQNKVDEIKANVICMDSLGMAVGDDLNLTKPAFTFFGALRQFPGVTSFAIAHTSKDKEAKTKTVYGNAYYENEARSIWEVCKRQEIGSPEATLTLHNRKSPPFAPIHNPVAFDFTFAKDKTLVCKGEPEGDRRENQTPSNTEVVLSILSEAKGPLFPKDISAMTDPRIPENNVRKALYDLKKKEKVATAENGGYVVK